MKKHLHQKDPKKGAALVLVLGILGILTVIALAFSTQVRTERLAGRHYEAKARSIQLLDTALAHAMEHIEQKFPNGPQDTYPFEFLTYQSPNEPLLASTLNFKTEVNYLPNNDVFEQALENATWKKIKDADEKLIGRIGYVVVNCTGLLDANHAGHTNSTGGTSYIQRKNGISPSEIQLSRKLFDEFNQSQDTFYSAKLYDDKAKKIKAKNPNLSPALAFIFDREESWNHFETINELYTLNTNAFITSPKKSPDRPKIFSARPKHFSTFSFFPQDDTSNENKKVDLSKGVNLSSNEFITALKKCQLPDETNLENLWLCYLDYCDENHEPTNQIIPCTEKVPMYSEFGIDDLHVEIEVTTTEVSSGNTGGGPEGGGEGTPGGLTEVKTKVTGTLDVEIWYPFDEPSMPPKIKHKFMSGDAETGKDIGGLDGEITVYVQLNYDTIYENHFELEADGSDNNGPFQNYRFTFDDTIENGSSTGEITKIGFLLESAEIKYNSKKNEETLDKTTNIEIEKTINISLVDTSNDKEDTSNTFTLDSLSCIDPRINYDAGDANCWKETISTTPNKTNSIDDWGENDSISDKTNIKLYVRDKPMENVSELGHLSLGKPWRTIRLYSGERNYPLNPVLDYFTVGHASSKAPQKGLININSPHKNVIASAFLNVVPEPATDHSQQKITEDEAKKFAQALVESKRKDDDFKNISRVGNAITAKNTKELYDAQRESIIGKSYRLFGWRDSLYTIVIAAQSLSGNETVQATQKAVVTVWRDPLTGKSSIVFYGRTNTLRGNDYSDLDNF